MLILFGAAGLVLFTIFGGYRDDYKRASHIIDTSSVLFIGISAYLATKCSKRAIDFASLSYLLIRAAVLAFILHMNDKEADGF